MVKPELGRTYMDRISGFEGVAVSRTEYLTGCARIGLQPMRLHEGKPVEIQYFDEVLLLLQEEEEQIILDVDANPGGPRAVPTERRAGARGR